MAGNKKPRKKLGKLGGMGAAVRARASKVAQAQNEVDRLNMLVRVQNLTGLGHESNRYKVDLTFGPMETALDRIEATGEMEVDEDGDACMRDPLDGSQIAFGPALVSSAKIFARIAPRFDWPPMPDGMRRAGAKVCNGMLLDDFDIAGMRETIAWMRAAIAEITPNEWSEICDEELVIDAMAAQKAA
jgi:hypothetical protein